VAGFTEGDGVSVVVERVDVWVWFEDVAGMGVDGDGEGDDVPAPEDIGIEEVGERGFGSLGVIERVIACTLCVSLSAHLSFNFCSLRPNDRAN
jgi:hypothetical protein